MNLKSLFASIGVAISSLFAPMKASANVYGNLLVPDLLYPSFEIDSMLVQNGSNLTFASYPNLFDVKQSMRSFSSGYISSASEIGVLTLTGGTSANYLGHAPLLKSSVDSRSLLGDTIAILNVSNNPYRYSDSSTRSFNSVDLIYTSNDIVISQTDLNDIAFNLYSFSQSNNGTLDYTLKFTLKSKTSSVGEYAISSYDYNVEHFGINLDNFASFGSSAYMYSIDLFNEFDFSEEEEYIWLTDFELHIGYSIKSGATTSVAGFGWDMPYYTSDVFVENTSFDNWLIANELDSSTLDCPTCPSVPDCPTCPPCEQDFNIVDMVSWIPAVLAVFFNFNIFPNFNLGDVFSVVIFVLFVVAILKIIAGG